MIGAARRSALAVARRAGRRSRRFARDSRESCSRFRRAPGRGAWPATPSRSCPSEIRLTLGVRDVLVLRNLDDVPQIFGPTLMMPGQSFRLPFAVALAIQFACTAHVSGQMTVVVEPEPATPWARLRGARASCWDRWHGERRETSRMSRIARRCCRRSR